MFGRNAVCDEHFFRTETGAGVLPVPAKAICGSFCRTENVIFNVVNYRFQSDVLTMLRMEMAHEIL